MRAIQSSELMSDDRLITVLGASGFVGRHLVAHLHDLGIRVQTPGRGVDLSSLHLGTVIDCAGLTADFRERPVDTVDAHVARLVPVIRAGRFERYVYLSSTRVYKRVEGAGRADVPIPVLATDPDDIFALSKLMGESLLLTASPGAVAVRLSNVYGPDWESANFLTDIMGSALRTGEVRLRSAPASAKDYISIDDTVRLLAAIASRGRRRVYNLASGVNVAQGAIVAQLAARTGCRVQWELGAPVITFPPIDVQDLKDEFGVSPRGLLDDLPALIDAYRQQLASTARLER